MTLPPLPPSPLVATMGFYGYHAQDMRSYGQQCAQHALQMAAEELRSTQGQRSSAESAVRSLMAKVGEPLYFDNYDESDDLK